MTNSVQSQPSAKRRLDSESMMQYSGKFAFWSGLGVTALAFLLANSMTTSVGSYPYEQEVPSPVGVWLIVGAISLTSLGAFMWMLGSIEQRLIEIRDGVKRDPTATKPDIFGV